MAEVALAVFLMLLLLTGKGYSQCFNNSDCTGDVRSASDVRSCCIGTNDGLSYMYRLTPGSEAVQDIPQAVYSTAVEYTAEGICGTAADKTRR